MILSLLNTPRNRNSSSSTRSRRNRLLGDDEVLLEGSHEGTLLGGGLESTVTELGRGVDPFELGLLEGLAVDLGPHGLAEGDDALLDAGDGALEDEEVVLDLSVANETAHAKKYK